MKKEVKYLDLAARLADDYFLTHKVSLLTSHILGNQLNFSPQSRPFVSQSKPYSPQSGPNSNPINLSDNSSHSFTPTPRVSKLKVLYPSQFVIIVNNQAISFLDV